MQEEFSRKRSLLASPESLLKGSMWFVMVWYPEQDHLGPEVFHFYLSVFLRETGSDGCHLAAGVSALHTSLA